MARSNIEFAPLELQRFWSISKNDRDKLRAKCGWRWCQRRPLRPSVPRAVRAASRPRREPRSALRLVVRPGPATHGHRVLRAAQPGLPISPAPSAPAGPSGLMSLGALHTGGGGGFALHEAVRGRVAGVSEPHVVQFPPIDGSEAPTCGGMVPKVQTTSAKTVENRLLWARRSAFWAQRCQASCAVRT